PVDGPGAVLEFANEALDLDPVGGLHPASSRRVAVGVEITDLRHIRWLNISKVQSVEYDHESDDRNQQGRRGEGASRPRPRGLVAAAAGGLLAAPALDGGDPRVRPRAAPLDRSADP